ncbi:hypothetical protein BAUCODRAFT_86571 [Baudoinia panamericana UAMH 10762]|uniref:Phosphoribosylaminoimidazole-succinocarboxamide synthase n=1 Tax=Baudoinia panamericana (strain UAMH 10762) TaxID=717646 RepID=M2N2L1_BAUPA|nr:uncharacterized protein BAUCODRAFT_86571 [Baudoinia panamericana UAMH 10762]EMC98173.1 hypothetical protein BAUCODRAFT_86571 [Baudoinia panamericana UAMH 10762]
MSNLSPQQPTNGLALKHTNVSNPSIIEHKPSLQSVTASEDYYSLSNSGSSTYSGDADKRAGTAGPRSSANTIHRFSTPPSRYRTPAQSRDFLPYIGAPEDGASAQQVEGRKTPMRGQGRRRTSTDEPAGAQHTMSGASAPMSGPTGGLREGGIRRKPVPSTVMEAGSTYRDSAARSSVAQDIGREPSPPTPEIDDAPFIRFALDQLTRDEEVRGSRRYRGLGSGLDGNYPYLAPDAAVAATAGPGATDDHSSAPLPLPAEQRAAAIPTQFEHREPQLPAGTEHGALPYPDKEYGPQPNHPPPRNPRRSDDAYGIRPSTLLGQAAPPHAPQRQQRQPFDTRFLPISSDSTGFHSSLDFLPGILRPLRLILFLLLLLAYTACLLFCAIWSLQRTGLWNYGGFGDARYFVFEYLPTILGMILFFWTIQIEIAVFRTAPFVAISSASPRERERGARLPLVPRGFLLPYFGHFGAKQTAAGLFVVVAWLQIWTIPLLASSFNVYFYGAPDTGRWRWIATQGAIWTVIALYLLLAVATITLLGWLKFGRRVTGLKWDPRSLADLVALLARSNALELADEVAREPPQLGYWRTNARPNEVFHAYGYPDKAGRQYSLEDGRIREKVALPPPRSRFSADPEDDIEAGDQRHSREKMLPRPGDHDDDDTSRGRHTALPWFLHPSMAALWTIIAIVLLLAFLIVSYLPSTTVRNGFLPYVAAPVNTLGFSSTNFLYSFVPALLGMLCLLCWLDIDYAYRRLQVFDSLMKADGEMAEHSVLLSYAAEAPGLVTATALVNGHWRVSLLSLVSLLAATLPILGGGVFWAQFYVATQRTRISAHMPAYYALTVFATLYALAYLFIFPGRRLRRATAHMGGNTALSFDDVLVLVRQSRLLDDLAFHSPTSKTDLVTRLLSAPAEAGVAQKGKISQHDEAAISKVSLADSVRGFGRARKQALGGLGVMEEGRYALGVHQGRDGREYMSIDRVRK